jgi:dienelactone hydrolase
MRGGGGLKATNYIYNVAARDGSVIGMPFDAVALWNVLTPHKVKYRATGFQWAELTRCGIPHTCTPYDGAGHGFAHTTIPRVYREHADRDSWAKIIAFLNETLGAIN